MSKFTLPFALAMAAALAGTPPLAEAATTKQPTARKKAATKVAKKKPTANKVSTRAGTKVMGAAPRTILPPRTIIAQPSTPSLDEFLGAGDHRFTIQHEGLTRSYVVHVPGRYRPTETAPMLVALNGNTSAPASGEGFARLRRESDYQGFIAVYPEAYGGKGQPAAWSNGHDGRKVNDVGFVAKVVHNVFRQTSVDRGRIYAAGVADGGTLAYQLACDLPHVFRGVASMGGVDATGQCANDKAVTVFHLQAQDDPAVPFSSAPRTMAKWAEQNGCEPVPRKVLQHGATYCEAYTYCRQRTAVKLCAPEKGSQLMAEAPTWGIGDSTRSMWTFLRTN